MKHIFYLCLLLSISPSLFAQQSMENDSSSVGRTPRIIIPADIDSRNLIEELNGVKELDDGFLLDLNLKSALPPRLSSSSFLQRLILVGFPTVDKPTVYFKKATIYDVVYGAVRPSYGLFSSSRFGGHVFPVVLQSAAFHLSNGWKASVFGTYNAEGHKFFIPGALPWERNDFRGAFEMKSPNGKFGVRIEVSKERENAFGF